MTDLALLRERNALATGAVGVSELQPSSPRNGRSKRCSSLIGRRPTVPRPWRNSAVSLEGDLADPDGLRMSSQSVGYSPPRWPSSFRQCCRCGFWCFIRWTVYSTVNSSIASEVPTKLDL